MFSHSILLERPLTESEKTALDDAIIQKGWNNEDDGEFAVMVSYDDKEFYYSVRNELDARLWIPVFIRTLEKVAPGSTIYSKGYPIPYSRRDD